MTWSSPLTFVAGSTVTAAQLNLYLRDNLNETAPAKATTLGRIFVSTAANAIGERVVGNAAVFTSESTFSVTYTDLATVGPAITVTTGTTALVGFSTLMSCADTTNRSHVSYAVSGATTVTASDNFGILHPSGGIANRIARYGMFRHHSGLTAGSNTFTMKYRNGDGGPSASVFQNRRFFVIAL